MACSQMSIRASCRAGCDRIHPPQMQPNSVTDAAPAVLIAALVFRHSTQQTSTGAIPVPQIIPQKAIEMWTALAVLKVFGGRATVYPHGSQPDPLAWPDNLGLWFIVEPRSPETFPLPNRDRNPRSSRRENPTPDIPCYRINRRHLKKFVQWNQQGLIPEVIYVLADPRKRPRSPKSGELLPLTHRHVWANFGTWTRAINARSLNNLIKIRKHTASTRVRWTEDLPLPFGEEPPLPGSLSHQRHPIDDPVSALTSEFETLLNSIKQLGEVPGHTLRAPELQPLAWGNRLKREHQHPGLTLTSDSLREAQRTLNELPDASPLLVGVPMDANPTTHR